MNHIVKIDCAQAEHQPERSILRELAGVRIERIAIDCPEIEFSLSHSREYIALHHLRLSDGETALEEAPRFRLLDMRNRLTFAPRGACVSGWSQFERGPQTFTAISLGAAAMFEEEGVCADLAKAQPLLYFQNDGLRQTIMKMDRCLDAPSSLDTLYLETLAQLLAIELSRILANESLAGLNQGGARLSPNQVRLIKEYIQAHAQQPIGLGDLSRLVGLSRFHFSRSFTRTVGVSPYQYAILVRIELAKKLLLDPRLRVKDVARLAGFSSPSDFSRMFARHTFEKPIDYRSRKGR